MRQNAAAAGTAASSAMVPRYLAEKILASRRFIEGERKQVTVLFADIRGSTNLIEQLDPEEVRRHFDPVIHIMMDAVHHYEGTVNQVLGDGIMALFGAPLAHEDHAVRACYAALRMQEGIRQYAEHLGAKNDTPKIGVGLNSGEVVVRSITNDLNIDYAALGHTTHLAARMEALAGAGSILMTAATLREVEGFVETKPIGPMQVKGFSSTVEAFELIGATGVRNRFQAAAARGLSAFVGRSAEIEAFARFTADAESHTGRVLALVGEAGMGKSRLVREFLEHHLAPGLRVLEASSVSYGKATAFFPIIELLRSYFTLLDGEDAAGVQRKVIEQVTALDETLRESIPPILTLLDAASSSDAEADLSGSISRFNRLEPQEKRSATFQALRQLFVRESLRQPVLMVFEDLHWIDGETQAFLDLLVESLPLSRIHLLVDYRPGYNHAWANKDYYTRVRVDPLPADSAQELIEALSGNSADLTPLKNLLLKRTEGNPFFIEEIVRSLTESGVLVGAKGAYRPGIAVESLRIPGTVRTVLADRIDRLPAAQKQLLQTAAVIGVVLPMGLLRAVSGLSAADLSQYLADLQASEFLYESKLFPELEYTFTHALTNEVVYNALLHERRTAIHRTVVDALESMAGGNPFEYCEALAHHAFQGELWEKAVRYAQHAGAKSMMRSAFLEAAAGYEKALAAAAHLPDGPAALEQQIDLHLEARNAHFLLGSLARVAEHLLAAEALAEKLGDEQRMARVLNFLNSYYGLAGDPERAIEIGERALRLNAVKADPGYSTVAHYYLGAAYNKTGQYTLAVDALLRGIENIGPQHRLERFGTAAVLSVICHSHIVQCLSALGRFDEGMKFAAEGMRLGAESDHATSMIHMACSVGMLHLVKGELPQAIEFFERSLALCRSANIPVYVPFTASRLGCAYVYAGRVADGLPYLEQGVDETLNKGRAAFVALSTASLAEGYLYAGRIDDAAGTAERALALAQQHKERGHEACALKVLGDISLHEGRRDCQRAETRYQDALTLCNDLGMRPLAAHCRMGLGSALAARGAPAEAKSEIGAALDQFRS
ncbi:MAG TPA: adenylate/guanylate cyclase domain-containing protein, partial [Candidatus Binatia bacterium]|nr:adenylate/guanylate cyclase domain-containing protein [Candidatus Binatia bacterium]